MIFQKLTHITDSLLTQDLARLKLETCSVIVTHFTNQQNKSSVVHSHPYHEIIIPISGSDVQYSFRGNTHLLRLRELLFFPAEMYHAANFLVNDTVSERLVIQINTDIWNKASKLANLQDASWMNNYLILSSDAVQRWDLRGLFERMSQIPYIKPPYQETILTCELTELIFFMNQLVEEQNIQEPGSSNKLLSTAVEYIRQHYTDPSLTVAFLADYTYTSREHLSRVFKEYTCESVSDYIRDLRMQHFRLEVAKGLSVLEACTNSGFTNYSSFLKSFRLLYGMTPTQYRNQLNSLMKDNRSKK